VQTPLIFRKWHFLTIFLENEKKNLPIKLDS
jgi:hypothetical protein